MAFISLGIIDKNLIIILIGCIVCFLNRLLNQYEGSLLFNNIILTVICISISRFLTFIPFIIVKVRSRRHKNNSNNLLTQLVKKPSDKLYVENIKGKWGLIILSAIIFFLQLFFLVLTFKIATNSWIWYILIASIFYYFIFRVNLYKHHYLSAIIILIIGLIIDLVSENLQNDISTNFLYLSLKFLKEIFFSLYNVLAKYVMEKKYVSIYEFSFYVGLISLILSGILIIFDYYFFKLDNYEQFYQNFNVVELLVILGVIITQLGINLTTLFATKNNSPCHVFIIFVFGQFAYYIVDSSVIIICLVFILFLSLVFNEIIELNFCGLSFNTKRNIIRRAKIEEDLIFKKDEIVKENIEEGNYIIELVNEDSYTKSFRKSNRKSNRKSY